MIKTVILLVIIILKKNYDDTGFTGKLANFVNFVFH